MVADYNGWTDLPEAEREALDLWELEPEPVMRRGTGTVLGTLPTQGLLPVFVALLAWGALLTSLALPSIP